MHISRKNRVRLVAAAAAIGVLVNPGQAAGDTAEESSSTDSSSSQSVDTRDNDGDQSGGGSGGSTESGGTTDTTDAGPVPDTGDAPATEDGPVTEIAVDPVPDSGSPESSSAHNSAPESSPLDTGPTSETSDPAPHGADASVPQQSRPQSVPGQDDDPAGGPHTTLSLDDTTANRPIVGRPASTLDGDAADAEAANAPHVAQSTGAADTSGAESAPAPMASFTAANTNPDPVPTVTAPAITSSALGFLALFGLPLLSGTSGATSTVNPAPWALLWFTRRVQSPLFNQSPNASHQLSQTDAGYTVALTIDDPDGDALTHSVTTNPSRGTVTRNLDGTYSYARTPGTTGPDSFVITVSDATNNHLHGLDSMLSFLTGRNPHTTAVTVSIPEVAGAANNAPIFGTPAIDTDTGSGVISGSLLATDIDTDDVLEFSTNWENNANPVGTFVLDPVTGAYRFTPTAEALHGAAHRGATQADKTVAVSVTVTDRAGATDSDELILNLTAKNAAPTASNPSTTPLGTINREDGTTTGALDGIADDTDGDALAYSLAPGGGPAHGTVQIGADGTFTYTPAADSRATTDTFTVTVDDSHLGGTVDIPVTVNTRPAYFHHIDSADQFGDPSDADYGDLGNHIHNDRAAGTVDYYINDDGQLVLRNTSSDALSILRADLNGISGTETIDYQIIAGGQSTVLDRRPGIHDFIVVQAPRENGAPVVLGALGWSDTGVAGTIPAFVNAPPVLTVSAPSAPAADSGVVTGTLTATDDDGSQLTYAVVNGTLGTTPNTFITPNGSILTIDPDAGTYTYTPAGSARLNASRLDADASNNIETITFGVSDSFGATTLQTVTVAVDGFTLTGTPYGAVQFSPDGTAYQTTYTYNSTTGYTTYLTRIDPTGNTTTHTLTGHPNAEVQISPDGTAYQTTYTYNTIGGYDYYLTCIDPAGNTTTHTLTHRGADYTGVRFSSDGTAYLTVSGFFGGTGLYTVDTTTRQSV